MATKLQIAAATIAGAIGVAAVASYDYGAEVDAALLDAGVDRTVNRITDLLTPPVEPGATITTGVSLPLGARATSVDGPGTFEVVSFTHEDRADITWLSVTVRNLTDVSLRFVGFATYTDGSD